MRVVSEKCDPLQNIILDKKVEMFSKSCTYSNNKQVETIIIHISFRARERIETPDYVGPELHLIKSQTPCLDSDWDMISSHSCH